MGPRLVYSFAGVTHARDPFPATDALTAADVVGPANQGIAAGQMARVIDAIRAGAAYGNVHSTMFPGGETRGQLRTARD